MSSKKKIVDARADGDGDIVQVRFEGNSNFTSVEKAIEMAQRGDIERHHVSHTGEGKAYLRSNPDNSCSNNLDELAGDKGKCKK